MSKSSPFLSQEVLQRQSKIIVTKTCILKGHDSDQLFYIHEGLLKLVSSGLWASYKNIEANCRGLLDPSEVTESDVMVVKAFVKWAYTIYFFAYRREVYLLKKSRRFQSPLYLEIHDTEREMIFELLYKAAYYAEETSLMSMLATYACEILPELKKDGEKFDALLDIEEGAAIVRQTGE
ncbi:MAG: hypothetical protein M1834_006197 [Cirrosporium novae-zelandiae]|nr:MAG: hypothetical protein M1834_006197 [Cirrosporium novae-zelandiae]